MCPVWCAWRKIGGIGNLSFSLPQVRNTFPHIILMCHQRSWPRSANDSLPVAQHGDDDVRQRVRLRDAVRVVPRHQQRPSPSDLEGEGVLTLHVTRVV